MPAQFAITTTASTIALDDALRAEAAFTVLNQTGAPIRARAFIVAQPPLDPSWLQLDGLAERSFPTGAAEQFLVALTIPPGTAEGQYQFRLDAVAADAADAESTQGPAIAFDVPHTEGPPPADPPGYLRTWLGALVGSLAGGLVGGLVSALLRLVLGSPLDAVVVLGLGVGATAGAWVALQIGSYRSPWRTALPVALLFLVTGVAIIVPLELIFGGGNLGIVEGVVASVGMSALLTIPALGGRAWYRWRTTGGL